MIITKSDEQALKDGCVWDQAQADRAVTFIEKYYRPSTIGKPITLMPWQREAVSRLYGWRDKSGHRRHRKFVLSTAKKNGKNVLQAGILLYELLGGVQPAPFCVSASTTRENAGQLYRELAYACRNDKALGKLTKCLDSHKEVRYSKGAGRYRAFSSDAGAAEGENLSALVVDELHAHQGDKLYRSLEYSTIARPDGLTCIISTAGVDQSSTWYDLFKYAQGVQAGDVIDTGLLPLIYTLDPEDDIDDPSVWHKANPSIGTAFTEESFAKDLQTAKADTSSLLSWKRYRANLWVMADDGFIDPLKFDACRGHVSEDILREAPLYVGVDLSQTTDPCSVSMVWALGDRKYHVRSHAWVCEEGVKRRELSNLPKYRTFEADGVMTITRGSVNDYRLIKSYLLNLRQRYKLKEIVYDQYNAIEQATELMGEGITVYRQPQNHRHYTAPVKEFEVATNEKRIVHDGNKLLRWALMNTRLDVDSYQNVKPSRDKSTDKIDPCISTLMAFGRAVEAVATGSNRKSVYEDRGPMVW
jgi:phage terminase large subunit-like protein